MTTTTEYVTEITGRTLTDPPDDYTRGTSDLLDYFTLLQSVEMECPSSEAREAWAHAQAMGAERNRARTERFDLATLGRDLGRGKVTTKQAEKAVLSSTSAEYRATKARLYDIAQREAFKACREALRTAGDGLLASPRTLIERALSEPDHVDSPDLFMAGVRLLNMVHAFGVPRVEGASGNEYLYRRPDLVEAWTQEHGGEAPTVRDIAAHADQWGPGVHTATEVLENAETFAPNGLPSIHPDPRTEPPRKRSVVWEEDEARGTRYPVAVDQQ